VTLLASLSGGRTASVEQALILLLIVAAAVAVAARRLGAPYTVGLVLVGLALGATSWFGELRLSSDLVFYVFLPILLFEAAFNLEARHLMSEWRRILVLAVPGVLVAFALTAAGMHLAGGVAWSVALLFGALISATDPVSVLALFRHLGVAPRLTTLVDAESLFNDGTAAVVFAVVVAAVVDHRHVTALWVAGDFVWMAAGGLGVGLVAGFAVSALLRAVDDHLIEITLSTIAAYGSFLLAQRLGMSGVVACVAAGIVVGSVGQRRAMSPVTRVTMGTVWEYAAFVANSLIFLLIGLRIDLGGIVAHLGLVLLAFVVVLAARAVAIYGFGLASRLRGPGLPPRWQHVLVWGGLRGTVALALVLSLPAGVAGRQTLEVVTFGVVLLSLVGQGLSMPWLVRRLGLVGGEAGMSAREREALLKGFVVAHEQLDRLQDEGGLPRAEGAHLARTMEAQEASLLEGVGPLDEEPRQGEQQRLAARLGALLAQRRRVEALRTAGVIQPPAAQELMQDIDARVALLGDRLACERDEQCRPGASQEA
jgi:monovalent cation:H+ antiporter, CPA1 family